MIRATKIYETVLYAHYLEAAAQFYVEGLGLPLLSKNDLMVVLGIGTESTCSNQPVQECGFWVALVPSHGGNRSGHVAFAVEAWQLPAFRERLTARVEIEAEVSWTGEPAAVPFTFGIRAGNSVELAPSHLWSHLPG